jgi:hypothetical protein
MRKRFWLVILISVVCCYVMGPCIAGSHRIGERCGPLIHPPDFHRTLYILAHEGSYNGEKPRESLDTWMYDRPFFYELPRRL